ncbi:unnamed protein product [Spirodela intermedia]|uniref:Uncharacterized protein n=1 Tax=Spirodela intermedia TaxID=51605 RepID=A0A7I8JMG1_SPIIN|nr:unnamed protein product [Spirodela intermedia]CAA6671347.1 unnamed protein product [Spirodela intermedia]
MAEVPVGVLVVGMAVAAADFRLTILDDIVFFVLSIIEAIVLVAVFCFYFCRFGCLI